MYLFDKIMYLDTFIYVGSISFHVPAAQNWENSLASYLIILMYFNPFNHIHPILLQKEVELKL